MHEAIKPTNSLTQMDSMYSEYNQVSLTFDLTEYVV